MSYFISAEDGYYALTTAGIVLCGVLIAILVLLTDRQYRGSFRKGRCAAA